MKNSQRKFYAQATDSQISLYAFEKVPSRILIFDTLQERNDFVFKHEYKNGVLSARKITRRQALKLLDYKQAMTASQIFIVTAEIFGSRVQEVHCAKI